MGEQPTGHIFGRGQSRLGLLIRFTSFDFSPPQVEHPRMPAKLSYPPTFIDSLPEIPSRPNSMRSTPRQNKRYGIIWPKSDILPPVIPASRACASSTDAVSDASSQSGRTAAQKIADEYLTRRGALISGGLDGRVEETTSHQSHTNNALVSDHGRMQRIFALLDVVDERLKKESLEYERQREKRSIDESTSSATLVTRQDASAHSVNPTIVDLEHENMNSELRELQEIEAEVGNTRMRASAIFHRWNLPGSDMAVRSSVACATPIRSHSCSTRRSAMKLSWSPPPKTDTTVINGVAKESAVAKSSRLFGASHTTTICIQPQ